MLKSDLEPAILLLKEADVLESKSDIVMESSPEDESKSNGDVEQPRQV